MCVNIDKGESEVKESKFDNIQLFHSTFRQYGAGYSTMMTSKQPITINSEKNCRTSIIGIDSSFMKCKRAPLPDCDVSSSELTRIHWKWDEILWLRNVIREIRDSILVRDWWYYVFISRDLTSHATNRWDWWLLSGWTVNSFLTEIFSRFVGKVNRSQSFGRAVGANLRLRDTLPNKPHKQILLKHFNLPHDHDLSEIMVHDETHHKSPFETLTS